MLNCKCLSTSRTGLYILNNAWHDVRAQCINISTSQATIDWICARLNYDSVNLIYNIKLLNVIYRKIPLDLLPTSPKYLYSDKIIPTVPKSHCFEKWRWIHFLWWRCCGSRRILQHFARQSYHCFHVFINEHHNIIIQYTMAHKWHHPILGGGLSD